MFHLWRSRREEGESQLHLSPAVTTLTNLKTHQLWGEKLNRNRVPSLLFIPSLQTTRRTAALHLPEDKGEQRGFVGVTPAFLLCCQTVLFCFCKLLLWGSSNSNCMLANPAMPSLCRTAGYHPSLVCPVPCPDPRLLLPATSLTLSPSSFPCPHPEPLLLSAQPGQLSQLLSPTSPHHPDCPFPAPALISPGALAPQAPGPCLRCLPHTMSPVWAWGTSSMQAPPHGVWDT